MANHVTDGVDAQAGLSLETQEVDSSRSESFRKKPAKRRKHDEVAAEVCERFATVRQLNRPSTDVERESLAIPHQQWK